VRLRRFLVGYFHSVTIDNTKDSALTGICNWKGIMGMIGALFAAMHRFRIVFVDMSAAQAALSATKGSPNGASCIGCSSDMHQIGSNSAISFEQPFLEPSDIPS
jgi:hypothetical protein